MSEHTAENDAPTRCPNCGGPLTGASHQTVCLINATAEIERLRHPASSDPRTHGGNHSPLPYGVYLAPGFCSGCDQARVIPPVMPADDDRSAENDAAKVREGARLFCTYCGEWGHLNTPCPTSVIPPVVGQS